MTPIKILIDRIDIRTRKTDDAIILTMETGEYEKPKVAQLLLLDTGKVYEVTIKEVEDE